MSGPMPSAIDTFLNGPNGLLAATSADFADWRTAGAERAAVVIHIELGEAADKVAVLAEFARGFDMPRWFGHNWDALADCLTDLDWLPDGALVLLIEGGMANPGDAQTLVSILRDCCDTWQDAGRAFHVLIDQGLLAHA